MMDAKRKSIAELSADSAVLISELSRVERGQVATYEDHFTSWLGRPVRNRQDIPTFATVERALKRDYGLCVSPIRGVGYRVLTQEEVAMNDSQFKRAGRAAHKRKQELSTVELSELSEEAKFRAIADTARAHIIGEAAGSKGLKRMMLAVNGTPQPLALSKALEALKPNL